MKRTIITVGFRRKRAGKTDYRKRLNMLKARLPRLVIRKSNKNLSVQVISFSPKGDHVMISVHSRELQKSGWNGNTNNLPAAYLLGLLAGKKIVAKKVGKLVLDCGMYTSVKGSSLYALVKGLVEAGVDVKCDEVVFPDEARLNGEHIAAWAKQLKEQDVARYERQFAACLKRGLAPEELPKHVEDIKQKL